MDKNDFLDCMKDFTTRSIGQMMLPVSDQKDNAGPKERAADIHLMRLSDSSAAKKKVPYIILQAIKSEDYQKPGEDPVSKVTLRSIFAVYNEDEQIGSLSLLGLMERLRIDILKTVIVGGRYELDIKESKLEQLIYPDNIAPYFGGEMLSVWKLPPVEREVGQWL